MTKPTASRNINSKYKILGESATSPIENTKRKEVQVSLQKAVRYDEQIRFVNANGARLGNINYTLSLANGLEIRGMTDKTGCTQRIVTDKPVAIVKAKLAYTSVAHSCSVDSCSSTSPLYFDIIDVVTHLSNFGTSIATVQTPKGQSRALTQGEIAMAQRIFANSIDYSRVKVHNGEYLWFGLQDDNTAMTPNGEIYFSPARFAEDFSKRPFNGQAWLIHEMTHVWQYQLGYPVMWRGAMRIGLSYEYALAKDKVLSDYNMEAQGDLLADYWALASGFSKPALNNMQHIHDLALFRHVLRFFIANPSDKRNLPGG